MKNSCFAHNSNFQQCGCQIQENQNKNCQCLSKVKNSGVTLTKTINNPTVFVGQPVTFTITATNPGPNPILNVTITDFLPSGLINIIVPPQCILQSQTVICMLDVLPVGNTIITITPTAPGTFINSATLMFNQNFRSKCRRLKPLTALITFTVLPITLLTLNKTTNPGTLPINSIVIRDTLPPGFMFVSASDPGCTFAAGVVTCLVGILAPEATFTVNINTTAPATPGTFVNSATTNFTINGLPFTVTASANVIVAGPPVIINRQKIANPQNAFVGDIVTFQITLTNPSGSIINGITVTDTIPANFTNVATTTPGCTVVGNTVTCNNLTLNSFGQVIIIITARAMTLTPPAGYTNIATISYTSNGTPVILTASVTGTISPPPPPD